MVSSCKHCDATDTNEMVQCDACDNWFHYSCVGVNDTVEQVPWSCESCNEQFSNHKLADAEAEIAELKKKLNELTLVSAKAEQSKPSHKACRSTTNIRRTPKSEASAKSKTSSVKRKQLALKKLEAEHKLNLEYLEKKLAIEEQECTSESDESEVSQEITKQRTTSWVRKQRSINMPQQQQQTISLERRDQSLKEIGMRQIMASNALKFYGSSEEWPMFISWFRRSTTECNFSDDENLNRLQQCLQGEALRLVRGYLFYPGTLNEVLNVLKNKYGRPEQILQSLSDQLRGHGYVTQERIDSILDFSVAVQHAVAAMRASGLSDYMNNPVLVQDLVGKLSGPLKLLWAEYNSINTQSFRLDLSVFADWLSQLATKVGSVATVKVAPARGTLRNFDKRVQNIHAMHSEGTSAEAPPLSHSGCVICSTENHHITKCQIMLNYSPSERKNVVREYNLCRKCLSNKHRVTRCKSTRICGTEGCTFKHHPVLHDPITHLVAKSTPKVEEISLLSHHGLAVTRKLFRIVPVVLYGPKANFRTFAFLDEGSTTTMIDEEIAQILGLKGPITPLHLRWSGETTRNEMESRRVSLRISGDQTEGKSYELSDVRTVRLLDLPIQTFNYDPLTSPYRHLKNLPVSTYVNAKPRILIGLNNYSLCLPLQVKEGGAQESMAAKTRLGWTVFGSHGITRTSSYTEQHHFHVCSCASDNQLHEQIKEFFSTEHFGVKKSETPLLSNDDQLATAILETTTKKISGRYVTGLLWRYEDIRLPDSYGMAKRRLQCLEQKMKKNPTLAENLKMQMEDYVIKDYARKLTRSEIMQTTSRTWYLPIFSVTNPNKPGKVRIVWDAAATVNGISLNSMLLKGPDLLCPLPNILSRFRERRVAISGDIKEMYHQVRIRKEDQQSQRFLWRNDSTNEVEVYAMCVMTFGASCSPSTAHFIKNKNAQQFINSKPRAVLAIQENHYVDDWLDSFDTEGEAITVTQDVVKIHAEAGFQIRNFVSNSLTLCRAIGAKTPNKIVNLDRNPDGAKVLGMWWSTEDDSFFYSMNFNRVPGEIMEGRRCPTKREVLRTLMMVFDPLGLISCFLVYLKILLQEIWRSPITWDQPITKEQEKKWITWVRTLPALRTIRIPRCYTTSSFTNLQMHIFVDASINAFAAAVYLRFKNEMGIKCVLVTAKTKVAPQQPMSIPRLELQAAVLGARLGKSVSASHSLQPTQRFFWSDSSDVLSWLRSKHRRYRQFVAFRVGEILDLSDINEWRWVPTRDNVADEATKWKEQPKINSNCRWFSGPEFLYLPEDEWPVERLPNPGVETEEEVIQAMIHSELTLSNLIPKYERFSNWIRLLRTEAWTLRFFWKAKSMRINDGKGELVFDEILRAEKEIFRNVQAECYANEIFSLKNASEKSVSKSSSIYKLTPFFDDFGILRVRGRATNVIGATYDAMNPIILPRNHPVTDLILSHYHKKYLHENYEQVINEVRQRFCIPRLRRCMQKIRSSCQACKNQRATPTPPQMAEHPAARVATFSAPFSYVGLDYCGPFEVVIGRRTEKRWVALFTCLTVRAIHLEVVHTLSKKSCWMAIRNFIARRGTPIEIRSDNGTNFVGVANELRELYKQMPPDDYRREFGQIKWLFNPPLSPHMGGCWERMVRSVKKALLRIVPSKRPGDEAFRCYLTETENMINSRPLTHVSLETEDQEALTPNHLLLGSSNGAKPLVELSIDDHRLRSDYELSQQMAEQFWRRWIKEYLPTLTRTTKWFKKTKSIEVGDVVIIMDDKHRDTWKKGKVIDVTMGKNNQVRRVVVMTPKGTYTRAAAKVAVLDVKGKLNPGVEVQCTEGENVTETSSPPNTPLI